jgi:ParB family chromosome partitioning protein
VRRTGEEAKPYEVIAGSRRHFAISWLRSNNYPNFEFVVQIEDIQDEQAFRLSDVENRARKDVSAWERGVSYQRALTTYYNNNVQEMADRLRMSSRNLRYLLDIARLPLTMLSAFASPTELTITNSGALIKRFKEGQGSQTAILNEALRIAEHQRELRATGKLPIPAVDVIKRLVAVREESGETDKRAKQGHIITNADGRTLMTWSPPRGRGGLSFSIPNDKTIDPKDLKRAFAEIVDAHFGKSGGR